MNNGKNAEPKIKPKHLYPYVTALLAFLLLFGSAAIGLTPPAEANPPEALQLSGGWVQTNWTAGNSFFSLCTSKNKVFARTWDSYNGGGMFLTANDGTNWTQIGSADDGTDILSILGLDFGLLAGTWDGFLASTDDGKTWNAFTPAGMPADATIWSIVKINATLFAGTTGAVYKSTDNGISWTEIGSGITADARITSIVASGDILFAGSADNGVFKWTNNATRWAAINSNLGDTHVSQLMVLDNKLFAVTLTGVYLSDNGGVSWAADPSSLKKVNCLIAVNGQIIAGTEDKGAYLSVDKGLTWTSFSTGMPADTRIWSLAVSGDRIFAGTGSGIWVTNNPTTANVEGEIPVPVAFMLGQNYPNPVSTSTTISFSIPVKSFVSLKIFDLQGKEVATIVSEEISAGYYTRKWNAANALGGIYFYRLQAGSYSETKKLFLMR